MVYLTMPKRGREVPMERKREGPMLRGVSWVETEMRGANS